jgi:hypothetical protein
MADFPIALSNVTDNVDDVMAKFINNIEALLGINGSAVTTSHSYKLSGVTSSDKAASLVGIESLNNKDLTSETNTLMKEYEGKKYAIDNPYKNGGSLHLKGQIHCHTTGSDGVDTPTELVTAYKNAGYDFITITDHDEITADPEVAGITWIGTGVEENRLYGRHVCVYDLTEQSTSLNTQDILNFHRNNAKMTSIAHPNWTGNYIMEENELRELYGFNFIEVYNKLVEGYADEQFDYSLSNGKKVFATSVEDCHDISSAAFNKGWIVVHTDTNSKSAILSSMRDGNFYASTGNDIDISLSGNIVTASSVGSSNFIFYGRNGRILKTENGVTSSNYTILGDEMYVRVKSTLVSDSTIAWSQPIFIDTLGTDDEEISKLPSLLKFSSFCRQAIINGNFDIWQKGVTLTNPATITYTADRWRVGIIYDGGTLPSNVIHSQQLLTSGDIPDSFFYHRIAPDGAGTSLGNGSYYQFQQLIKHGCRYLCGSGKKVTLSFWARSSIAGKRIGIDLQQYYGSGGSPSAVETINGTNWTLTSTWKKYTYTFITNTLVGKTFGSDYNDWLRLDFMLLWGSNYQARVGASTAETFVGAGNIDIAQVQLCSGGVALPFMPKSEAQERSDCQEFRWYATVRAINGIMYYSFPVTMRVTPTVLTSSVGTIANGTRNGFQITHNANADADIVAESEI